jgi:pimeloyl-ACP methyl ester carboxylesterase
MTKVNGLAYDEAGIAPALVFVHAGLGDRRMWEPRLRALSARSRVGRCDGPMPDRDPAQPDPAMWQMVLDMLRVVFPREWSGLLSVERQFAPEDRLGEITAPHC